MIIYQARSSELNIIEKALAGNTDIANALPDILDFRNTIKAIDTETVGD